MKRIFFYLLLVTFALDVVAQPGLTDPVSWTFKSEKVEPGVYDLYFTAVIDQPWHMYAIEQEKSGPIPTSIIFNENENVTFQEDLTEITKPKIKFDEGFKFNVGAYYNKAEFKQRVRAEGDGVIRLTGFVEYQCCNDETCLPPFTRDFSFRLSGITLSDASREGSVTEATEEQGVQVPSTEADSDPEETQVVPAEGSIPKSEIGSPFGETGEKEVLSGESFAEESPDTGRGMAGFLLLSLLLGFAAILTPCVYPMIPMTISFFMRGGKSKAMVVLKGLVFGFSMILVYTGLGVLVSLTGVEANIGNVISTHWIPNLIFFLLFMIFAASFLGMFEIVLPSGLVNKVDKQADRGGLVGPFFMGLTTVLVSFSCTGPIVGSLLTEAAGGEALKPIMGMFAFSLAFALPFTLLAIFPSMLKSLPKSGGWLNSVKVVLGFFMLAFGMKFLSSIDQAYHLNIFTREIYLAIWFMIAIFLGLYLLGKIRVSHDSELNYIPVPRMLLSLASFVFAIYLFTGIFGNDLQSIGALIPPKSSQHFMISTGTGSVSESDQSSTWCGPGRFDDQFDLPHGIKGYFTFEDGLECAQENDKPIFLDFTGHSCSNCKQMENQVWSDPQVLHRLKEEYVVISLYTDDKTRLPENEWITDPQGKVLKTIGQQNVQFEMERFGTFATPWYVLMGPDGELLNVPRGKELNIESFLGFLDEGLENFQQSNKE